MYCSLQKIKTVIYYCVLAGEASCGKDTSANILNSELMRKNVDSVILSLAEPIKLAVSSTSLNKEDNRPAWQAYGECMRERYGQDYFAKVLCEKAEENYSFVGDKILIIIPDLRLPEEFNYFKNMENALNIKIFAEEKIRENRMGKDKWSIYKEKSQKDKTETGIGSINETYFDYIIHNNFNRIDKLQYNLISLIEDKIIGFMEER